MNSDNLLFPHLNISAKFETNNGLIKNESLKRRNNMNVFQSAKYRVVSCLYMVRFGFNGHRILKGFCGIANNQHISFFLCV